MLSLDILSNSPYVPYEKHKIQYIDSYKLGFTEFLIVKVI